MTSDLQLSIACARAMGYTVGQRAPAIVIRGEDPDEIVQWKGACESATKMMDYTTSATLNEKLAWLLTISHCVGINVERDHTETWLEGVWHGNVAPRGDGLDIHYALAALVVAVSEARSKA